ncbi:HPr(Ser) kinase/phosphatase [Sulfuriflexus mobilis]|uniref:HPr(Ser) kinase/phosphatase n=1 Tax=Sulfuriflexus mobilis TaxID=1811807 RepID=UPI000F83D2E0|nr:HPr(Ser) kinase/phosphatase [Sulfuriflexus mobilis]
MTENISVKSLFDTHRNKLALVHVAGSNGEDRHIHFDGPQITDEDDRDVSYVGHLNFIHPHRIQIIGYREIEYFMRLSQQGRHESLNRLYEGNPLCIIIANGIDVPDDFIARSENTGLPLYSSTQNSQFLVNNLQYYLSHSLAERATIHGVFMEVIGIGVLLSGESSVGKSELALELISRGHRLIADDAPEFSRIGPDTLSGSCPPPIKNFLEVRGLGVLNIRAMFGDSAIKDSKYLRVIVHLEKMDEDQLLHIDRLCGSHQKKSILGVEVEQVTLPVAPGRNLAVLVEIAVRNHILTLKGYHAAEDFIQRQQQFLEQDRE